MIIKLIGEPDKAAYQAAIAVVRRLGHAVHDPNYFYCDLAIAPLLIRRLTSDELIEPVHGVLVFHPSPLPYGRGASAIKHAFNRGEPVTAATWFWASDRIDAGDICEMEILRIDYAMRPRVFYEAHMLPALERTLQRCLTAIAAGYIRRVPQVEAYSSFDLRI